MDQEKKEETLIPSYFKLMNGEDIVAYLVEDHELYYLVKRPLAIHVDSSAFLGKAFLHVREWIPPVATKGDTLVLQKKMIMVEMDCNDDFISEFKELSDYFYTVAPLEKAKKKVADAKKEDKKVIPFVIRDDSGEVH